MKKISYNSPVILSFALLSLGALILGNVTGGWTNVNLFSVYRSSLLNVLTYFRMFAHVLGHSDYTHYISNMLLILVVGPMMEEKFGSKNLLIAILITSFVTGLSHFVLFPGVRLLGASGIVFMLVIMASFANTRGGTIPVTLILVTILYLGNEIIDMVVARDNISQLSHVIGGLCGAFIGFSLTKRRKSKR